MQSLHVGHHSYPHSEYTEVEAQLLRSLEYLTQGRRPKFSRKVGVLHAEVWQFDQRRQRSMPEMQECLLITNFYCDESP